MREQDAPSLPESGLLARLGVTMDGAQSQALESYSALVARWNGVAGLVSRGDLHRFSTRHLLDSLVLAPMLRAREGPGSKARQSVVAADSGASLPVADFGSGGGLPGIPLAVALPELEFVLVDRSEKKVRFLRRVRDELALPNVRVVCADVRRLPPGGCRAVVARAAMPMPALWRAARLALASGGYLLALDRIVRAAQMPAAGLPEGCKGARIRRHWTEMPQPAAGGDCPAPRGQGSPARRRGPAERGGGRGQRDVCPALRRAWHGVLEVREMNP